MNLDKLDACVKEAKEFIARAQVVKQQISTDGYRSNPRETGALRRTSMELTRALADLRRP